ncbi:MAG: DNA-binding response regulator [Bacteroidetes bacterium GWD2_45_23]|nr:MAG: DNA-binding response regulator [Bacteroidetes bacterium GWC2_46_850]OFX80123.1 MAG: DNA-binding response regulator [Bacteroidetes bacterium GWC1_47_7]OFX85233.1 MAG: DNA-binding response regulator [Bacteroidetes bacterium GWD2_45_23]HAR37437.1 DNA-binding response regulator [Porphyromonadaceae bacterium]HBB00898.1 DNA-binding response regulator [Porphyromonadaceae bacterium]
MILNCWIVDDEPLALSLLESYVQKTSFLRLTGKYSNALSAMKQIAEEKVDLLFLDIQMPEINGMEFARTISHRTRVIFTTAFSEYALEGYKVSALDYLLKPFSFDEFLAAARKALEWFEMTASRPVSETVHENIGIFVKSEYRLLHVLYEEIIYIEGLKDYVKIYTENEPKPILSLMSLKLLEEELPADRFMRVHRSYIIHRNKITSINKNRIIIGKKQIPIGETYRKQFRAIIEGK